MCGVHIGDNYLFNVFTDYNYSNSLIFKSMFDKYKKKNYRLPGACIAHLGIITSINKTN